MSAPPRGTASQYSKGISALRGAYSRVSSGIAGSPKAVRWALAVVGLAGAALLIVSEFLPITHVRAITVILPHSERTGLDQNSGAMLCSGWSRCRSCTARRAAGSRPAMVAVGAIGAIALLIAVFGDLPDVTQAGTCSRSATRMPARRRDRVLVRVRGRDPAGAVGGAAALGGRWERAAGEAQRRGAGEGAGRPDSGGVAPVCKRRAAERAGCAARVHAAAESRQRRAPPTSSAGSLPARAQPETAGALAAA